MEIDPIKIEPLIIVKNEPEIDDNTNFDVKLEDDQYEIDEPSIVVKEKNYEIKLEIEEKPQLIEEFTFGENEPSTSENVKEGEYEFDELSNVVKEENYEIKLEDEEKPQLVEEFLSEEKKPSSSKSVGEDGFELSEKNLHTCSYCGDRKTLNEMVQTPETEKELMKWSNILGEEFCENFTIRSPICRSHFIDEYGNSRLIDVVRGNKIVETKIGDRVRCCYCGVSRINRYMTTVPKDENRFVEWVKILGMEFQEYFERNSNGFICRTHFDIEWQGKRPKTLLPIANDTSEKNVLDEMSNERILSQNKIACAFCESSKYSHEMTKIPQRSNNLKIWGDLLGEDFYTRALSKKSTYICQSHFDVEWKQPVGQELLSIVNDESEENTFDDNVPAEKKKSCAYCGKSKISQDMTKIPSNPETLKLWAQILGDEFYRRALSNRQSFICRSHFDVQWDNPRPRSLLPCVGFLSLKERKEKTLILQRIFWEMKFQICCYCGEKKNSNEMIKMPGTVEELIKLYPILGEKFYEVAKKSESSMICRRHLDDAWRQKRLEQLSSISGFNKNLAEKKNDTRNVQLVGNCENNSKHIILCVCAYCGKKNSYSDSTTVPRDPSVLKKWGQILGEEFYKKARSNSSAFICRSHFSVEWVHLRPSNVLPHAEPVRESLDQVNMKEEANEEYAHILNPDIQPENQKQEFESQMNMKQNSKNSFPCDNPTAMKQENFIIQDGPSDLKRIKLESKRELEYDIH